MSGGGNPNHDPKTGEFASNPGSPHHSSKKERIKTAAINAGKIALGIAAAAGAAAAVHYSKAAGARSHAERQNHLKNALKLPFHKWNPDSPHAQALQWQAHLHGLAVQDMHKKTLNLRSIAENQNLSQRDRFLAADKARKMEEKMQRFSSLHPSPTTRQGRKKTENNYHRLTVNDWRR